MHEEIAELTATPSDSMVLCSDIVLRTQQNRGLCPPMKNLCKNSNVRMHQAFQKNVEKHRCIEIKGKEIYQGSKANHHRKNKQSTGTHVKGAIGREKETNKDVTKCGNVAFHDFLLIRPAPAENRHPQKESWGLSDYFTQSVTIRKRLYGFPFVRPSHLLACCPVHPCG